MLKSQHDIQYLSLISIISKIVLLIISLDNFCLNNLILNTNINPFVVHIAISFLFFNNIRVVIFPFTLIFEINWKFSIIY